MPPLTSFYILQKEFTKERRGYATGQVDAFLDQVAKDFTQLQDEIVRLRQQSDDRAGEESIARALLKAQQLADQTVEEARATAQTMVAEAEAQAKQATEQAEMQARLSEEQARMRITEMDEQLTRRREELDGAIKTLRRFERDYRARLRGFVEDQLKLLEDATPVDSLAPPSPDLKALPGRADELPAKGAGAEQPGTTRKGADRLAREA